MNNKWCNPDFARLAGWGVLWFGPFSGCGMGEYLSCKGKVEKEKQYQKERVEILNSFNDLKK